MAIGLLIINDFIFSTERASTGVRRNLDKLLTTFEAEFTRALEGKPRTRVRKTIQKLIDDMTTFGAEAAKEPRFWRRPWNPELFQAMRSNSRALRAELELLEHAIAGPPKDSSTVLDKIMALPAWAELTRDYTGALADAVDMCGATFRHEAEEPLEVKGLMERAQGIDTLEPLPLLRKQMGAVPVQKASGSLEADALCRIWTIFCVLQHSNMTIARIFGDCFKLGPGI